MMFLREVRAMFIRTNILDRAGSVLVQSLRKQSYLDHIVFAFMVWNSGNVTVCQQLTDCDLVI